MTLEQQDVQIQEKSDGKIVEIHVTGSLDGEEYQQFVPQIERLIERHGKIRMLVYLHEFQGWSVGALWDDIKFSAKHFRDIDRLAVVGESKWQEGMATFCKPFTSAKIKYFDHDQLVDARQWVEAA